MHLGMFLRNFESSKSDPDLGISEFLQPFENSPNFYTFSLATTLLHSEHTSRCAFSLIKLRKRRVGYVFPAELLTKFQKHVENLCFSEASQLESYMAAFSYAVYSMHFKNSTNSNISTYLSKSISLFAACFDSEFPPPIYALIAVLEFSSTEYSNVGHFFKLCHLLSFDVVLPSLFQFNTKDLFLKLGVLSLKKQLVFISAWCFSRVVSEFFSLPEAKSVNNFELLAKIHNFPLLFSSLAQALAFNGKFTIMLNIMRKSKMHKYFPFCRSLMPSCFDSH
ncbi:hypothetical protein GEMRC1_005054 [Eukaryota sp. GEM-RC1]